MSRSLQEYHERWQHTMQKWNLNELVEAPDLTNESCAIFESGGSSPMDEGMLPFPDFGDAICYYRYYRLPEEPVLPEPQQQNRERHRSNLSNDELRERLAAATQALDSLLEEFVQHGYRAEMSKRLQEIVNHSSIDLHLFEVYVLPGDLDALLSFLGNPLADYDTYENEEEAEAHSPAFDLNNPEHRAALKESIWMVGR
jgi:hypothetical protein